MSDSGFVLETRWPTVALKYLVETRYGHPFQSDNFNAEGLGTPVIRIRDVVPAVVSTWAEEEAPSKCWVEDGDIVIGMDGDFNHVRWSGGPAAMNQRVCSLHPNPDLDSRFLSYVISYPLQRIHDTVHYTTVKHLSFSDLLAEEIPLPPLDEQRRIADYLDERVCRLEAAKNRSRELQGLVEERRTAVIVRCVTRGLVNGAPSSQSLPSAERFERWIDGAPASWKRARLKNAISDARGGVWGADAGEEEVDVTCFRAADFDRVHHTVGGGNAPTRSISHSDLRRHALRPGDLVLEKSGGGPTQAVGAAALVTREVLDEGPAVCSNFTARIRPSHDVIPRYLNYALAAAYRSGVTQRSIKQTTGIQNLDLDHFLAERWAFPPQQVQRRIADALDDFTAELDGLLAALRRQDDLTQEKREALITAAVTGQLDVATAGRAA